MFSLLFLRAEAGDIYEQDILGGRFHRTDK